VVHFRERAAQHVQNEVGLQRAEIAIHSGESSEGIHQHADLGIGTGTQCPKSSNAGDRPE
jgi:hypothetical protein